MADLKTVIRYQADLNKGVVRQTIRPALLQEDAAAHKLEVSCVRGGEAVLLTDEAVMAYFVRQDGRTVLINGTVEDGKACVVLPAACYAVDGTFELVLRVSSGGDNTSAIYWGGGAVRRSRTSDVVDPGQVIPSLEQLLAKIDAMEKATAAAQNVVGEYDSKVAEQDGKISQLSEEIEALKGEGEEGGTEIEVLNIDLSSGYYYALVDTSVNIYDKKMSNASSLYTPEPVDLGASAVGKKLQIIVTKYSSASARSSGFCMEDGTILSYSNEKNDFVLDEETGYYVKEMNIVGRYLFISISSTSTIVEIRIIKEGASANYKGNSAYVSVDGSDTDGTGAESSPFATVSKALNAGYTDIVVKGGVYKERIAIDANDRNHDGKRVSISPADPDGRVIFVDPDATIATAETLVSGYTKVYSAATDKTFADNNVWIFQDGIQDATTLITDAERHPLERGQEYRCEDTKIERCTATALADALAEIEAADTYKWYIESGTIYFSRPQAITADNPLCGSFGAKLFDGFASRARTIELVGIESKYMMINVGGMSRATLKDCKAVNVYGAGAFTYDQSASVEFVRCEAARCFYGGLGDGFNGHATNTGDPFSKQTTALFVDCWSHDNNDDGYSDHERSETTIIGGLYEYNGKAGVTPAGGSHCTCYNVISRNNYCGFFYTNGASAEEGGKGGQMMCIGCVAENNTRGGTKTGFRVTTAGNSAILIGCKSIGHDVGYACGTDTQMRLVDCGSLNDATVKSGSGLVVENTTLVS